jgi:hypothetical protein
MRSFRDGFERPTINKNKEKPIPRSFKDGFARPALGISGSRIMSIPFTCLYWADRIIGNDGDSVSAWPDIKGNYDAPLGTATPATLSTNIIALNEHKAVTFTGTQAYQNTVFTTVQPFTIILIWDSTSGTFQVPICAGNNANVRLEWRDQSPDILRITSDNATFLSYSKARPSSYIITTADFNSTSSAIYEGNPTTAQATGNAGTGSISGITIGAPFDFNLTYALNGNIALAGCVDGGLDAAEKIKAFEILNDYYGIY